MYWEVACLTAAQLPFLILSTSMKCHRLTTFNNNLIESSEGELIYLMFEFIRD